MTEFSFFRQTHQNGIHPPPGKMLPTTTLTGNLIQNQGWAVPSFVFHTWLLKLFSHKICLPVRKAPKIAYDLFIFILMMISCCNILNITCGLKYLAFILKSFGKSMVNS